MPPKLEVLIVEDDFMIAELTEEILAAGDWDVCGIAGSADAAMTLARLEKPDIALVDLRLGNGERGTDVAARLLTLGRVGILYVTGNAGGGALAGAIGEARLLKPYRSADFLRAMELVAEIVATGEASPPFPERFRRLPEGA